MYNGTTFDQTDAMNTARRLRWELKQLYSSEVVWDLIIQAAGKSGGDVKAFNWILSSIIMDEQYAEPFVNRAVYA